LLDERRSCNSRSDWAEHLFRHAAVVGVVTTSALTMTTVELSQHTIKLEPPQRLLMLEVTSEEHGFCLRMFPADGVEANDLRLLSKSPGPVSSTGASAAMEFDSMSLMRRLSEAFPQLGEIDVRNVPQEYRMTFGSVGSHFHFQSGECYRISGVGEHVWETTAIAK
jgi:hypothetical protein